MTYASLCMAARCFVEAAAVAVARPTTNSTRFSERFCVTERLFALAYVCTCRSCHVSAQQLQRHGIVWGCRRTDLQRNVLVESEGRVPLLDVVVGAV